MLYTCKKGTEINDTEKKSLYNLFLEEENVRKALDANDGSKLFKYGKDINAVIKVNTSHFEEYLNNYDFIIIEDKNERILAYLAYEVANFITKTQNTEIYIVNHAYVANEIRRTDAMHFMFSVIEDIAMPNTIYCPDIYITINAMNGYSRVTAGFSGSPYGAIHVGKDKSFANRFRQKDFIKYKKKEFVENEKTES